MSVFVIGLVTIKDRPKYVAYEQSFRDALTPFGGEILAVEDAARVLEGVWPAKRTVILRFPREDAAQQWYGSKLYQELVSVRSDAAEATIAILSAQ